MTALLEVRELVTQFTFQGRSFNVVDGISLEIDSGQTVGIVGESGSGKSLTLRSLMHALPPTATIAGGQIAYRGADITQPSRAELRRLRGREIGMIFQDPSTALNPVLTIGSQLDETLKVARGMRGSRGRHQAAIELLRMVGVPEPDRRMSAYPHEMSGGMAQRVVIALALVAEPKLLLADEPTSALDVTVQAQILQLLVELQARLGMAVLLVSHDLGVIAQTCDTVCVMYAGRFVEIAPVAELFARPGHPYTVGLLSSIPSLDSDAGRRLRAIPGSPPDLSVAMRGCRFHRRCPIAVDGCTEGEIPLSEISDVHSTACIRHEDVRAHGVTYDARTSKVARA